MRIELIGTIPRWWSCLGLVLLLPGCGGDGGGGSSGGGTDDGGETSASGDDGADDESGDRPPPDEDGDECGGDIRGWETNCKAVAVTATASDKGEIPGAPMAGDHTGRTLCCEGSPSVETADAGCESICLLEVCEAARVDHMNRCATCGPFNCGFDMTDCLAGGAHTQSVICATPAQVPFGYTLTASCSAFNNETRNPDGSFDFLERPTNIDTTNDPPICEPPENLDHEPPRGLGQYAASASDGTIARVTWAMADAGGQEQSEELDVWFEYALLPCDAPSHECMQLTALELALPPTEVLGMTLTEARLSVIEVAEAPMMERDGRFQLSARSLRVLLQAHVNGFPLVLRGWNVGTPQGQLAPAGDQLSLTGLRFDFADSFITAALEIDVHGRYDARRPNAQITRTSDPKSCAEPVTLLATSWDDDQEPLTHRWWIRDVGSFEGPLVEVVLPAGEHDVMLTSFDPTGSFDGQTLRYERRCR